MKNLLGIYMAAALMVMTAVWAAAMVPLQARGQAFLTNENLDVNTPAVTVRLVETRTAELPIQLNNANTLPATPKIEIPVDIPPTMDFMQPEEPVIERPEVAKLVETDNGTFRLQPLIERPVRATMVR